MIITSVTMEVSNYKVWRTLFDQYTNGRKALGSLGGSILKKNNGKYITILLRWSDKKKAMDFHESNNLSIAMNKAGVVSTPVMIFYEEEEFVDF